MRSQLRQEPQRDKHECVKNLPIQGIKKRGDSLIRETCCRVRQKEKLLTNERLSGAPS
jgi:hypothetical protein